MYWIKCSKILKSAEVLICFTLKELFTKQNYIGVMKCLNSNLGAKWMQRCYKISITVFTFSKLNPTTMFIKNHGRKFSYEIIQIYFNWICYISICYCHCSANRCVEGLTFKLKWTPNPMKILTWRPQTLFWCMYAKIPTSKKINSLKQCVTFKLKVP